jgi:hypothetical protein
MATSVSAKKTAVKISLERLSADADKAVGRAEAAKEQVRSAKVELKKARKLAKLAKKAAKQAKKKIEAARAAAARTPAKSRPVKLPAKTKTPAGSQTKDGAAKAAARSVPRKPLRARASAGDVAKAVINRMAAKRAQPSGEATALPAVSVSGNAAAAPAA